MKLVKLSLLGWTLLYLTSATQGKHGHHHHNKESKVHVTSPFGRLENFGPELNHRHYEAPSIEKYGTFSGPSLFDPNKIATNFIKTKLHPETDFIIKNSYKSEHNGVTHIYFKQIVNGLPVSNSDLNVNVDRFGRIISYGDSFANPKKSSFSKRPLPRPSKNHEEEKLIDQINNKEFVGGSHHSQFTLNKRKNGNNDRRHYESYESNDLNYNIINDKSEVISPEKALQSFMRFIDKEITHPEKITYTEYNSLDNSEPKILLSNVPFSLSDVKMSQAYIQTDEQLLQLVWEIEIEMENNWYNGHINAHTGKVMALMDWVSDATYNVFPFGINDPSDGDRKLEENPHDIIASPYGWHSQGKKNFTNTIGNNVYAHENLKGRYEWENNYRPEVAGNFQQDNHGKGGLDKDPVIANAQDDGQHGKMRMYVWNVISPWRDGGPANSGCLGWGESGGMGEGWGDFFATIFRMNSSHTRTKDFGMGDWANGGEGIRKYPYSTSLKTNPETFIYLDKPGYWGVHAKGAVWAEILYEVYWNLVDKHGFTSEWLPPVDNNPTSFFNWYSKRFLVNAIKTPKHGNTLTLQLVVDGLKLQPCRPSFIDARNAIIQADEILTNGDNRCEIWKGFAKRGLGVKAKVITVVIVLTAIVVIVVVLVEEGGDDGSD
ncbi:11678_t:CDS:2 [Diversispora eburnea]|uniref:Extracellular metalloproteinase n=1 Tax=Diversispora eburnea TaxID=1213867 RepID=A0A9N9GB51_9GLOM|nr:11678_t:CDS:2 [Diversispora eburnea]